MLQHDKGADKPEDQHGEQNAVTELPAELLPHGDLLFMLGHDQRND